jgi:2-amino-4-hydroxy-6-hydroxymethyldihydropteridine diphosphokinase
LLLQNAWQALADHPHIAVQKLSSPYKTRPVDMDSPYWFINAAGLLTTSLTPRALLALLLQVEQQYGRVRSAGLVGHQDRTLDLDLLLFDDRIIDTPELILPHPAMDARLFVLAPLAEIGRELVHPLRHVPVSVLLARLQASADPGDIEQVSWVGQGELL